MKTSEILLVPKITKVEWDMHRLKLTEKELRDFYKKENLNAEKIFDSHEKQKSSLKRIKQILEGCKVVERNSLTKEDVKNSKLVISFGGDNHFNYVSHFCDSNLVVGVNSDPERSVGAMTYFNVDSFEFFLPSLLNDDFEIEEWPRIEIEVDGKMIETLCVSEIFIGESDRVNMSRHILKLNGNEEEQKGSGIVVTTGTGSTGWYDSACRYIFSEGNKFGKTSKELRFVLTEPFNGKYSKYNMLNGVVKDGENLEIVSLSDSDAVLSIDSLKVLKLKEGSKVRLKIGKALSVIKYIN